MLELLLSILSIVSFIVGAIGLYLAIYYEKKSNLKDDVLSVLADCKNCSSWDERSEYKLSSWMNGTSVNDLHRLPISDLKQIRRNLRKYYAIHLTEL